MSSLKDNVLSGNELFHHRTPQDKSIPQRGGAKDFCPDGSWLQNKWLEAVSQERNQVLGEHRVEKVGSLVRGEWNPDLKLVELEKEMGKFWVHMGFVDHSRKWLYPEEALFLMETNTLIVNYKGLPLSIQQAYAVFLNSTTMTTEHYVVYAHLRRLGYVVLKHQGKLNVTKYEKKIHLDKHSQVAVKRKKRKMGETSTDMTEDKQDAPDTPKKMKKWNVQDRNCSDESNTVQDIEEDCKCENSTDVTMETVLPNPLSSSQYKNPPVSIIVADKKDLWNTLVFLDNSRIQTSTPNTLRNFTEINFPDLGGSHDGILHLKLPSSHLLPDGIVLSSKINTFNVDNYKKTKCDNETAKNKLKKHGVDSGDLEFSFGDIINNKSHRIVAKNWKDYKEKLSQHAQIVGLPSECLWKSEVTPLINPAEAVSTADILNRLQIIHSSSSTPGNLSQKDSKDRHKIIFDVYLPDSKFKKSRPGLPDYRICVMKSCEEPPDLRQLLTTQQLLQDDVPINWAVVDGGEISFFQFLDATLPVEINLG